MRDSTPPYALFTLGFRPFFWMAALFALFSIGLWLLYWVVGVNVLPAEFAPALWHGHEMIFGYALAVVAGFLLTAVRNWTGIATLHGRPLQGLVFLWLLARLLPFVSATVGWWLAMVADTLWIAWLAVALTHPIVLAKKWKNLLIIALVYGMLVANTLFNLGMLNLLEGGTHIGIYLGLYLLLALILLLAGRVMPMFIRNGVDHPFTPCNRRWVNVMAMVIFPLFVLADLLKAAPWLVALLSALLAVLHALRLSGWYTPAIWRKPLLWVLVIAYGWIVFGFALKAAAAMGLSSPVLALHSFAVGGIGMISLGMMARVAWGHSGRDLNKPPSMLAAIFSLLTLASVMRIVMPLLLPNLYLWWLALSQVLWLSAFCAFLWCYTPVLWLPREDDVAKSVGV